MLTRLYADNIRCLSNFELRPGPISALIGPNGAGKTTVFELLNALQVLLGGSGARIEELVHPSSQTRWDSRNVQRVELEVQPPGSEAFVYSLEVLHDEDRRTTVIQHEQLLGNRQLLYRAAEGEVALFGDEPSSDPRVQFPVDPRRSFLSVIEPRRDNKRITAFKDWLSNIWVFRLRPEIDPFSDAEATAVRPDGRNFVSWFRTLQQEAPDVTEKVRQEMRALVPGLSGMRLEKAGTSKGLIFDCEIRGRKFSLNVAELSDGQRVLLVLYTILHALAPRASLLVFDEPDNFVADAEIQPWLSRLREQVIDANRGTLLVMSHHPEVLDYLAADQLLRLSREDDGPTRMTEVQVDRTQGLSASEWLRLEGTNG